MVGALTLAASASSAAEKFRVYVGTYTGAKSKGIYVAEFDSETGVLTEPVLAVETVNPSFLATHPKLPILYAVDEVQEQDGEKGGGVSAFRIEGPDGKLNRIGHQSSRGADPCHLVVDKAGKTILVANYTGGSVSAIPLDANGVPRPASQVVQHTGSSINKSRQEGPHAHSVNLDAANRFAVVADLGLDRVMIYRFGEAAHPLSRNEPPSTAVSPGSGPRHFAFHPNGRLGFVINEIASTITTFDYDPRSGALTNPRTISTLPADFKGTSHTAEVVAHPTGKFVYGSNRGHDSIAAYSVGSDGSLSLIEIEPTGGQTPRNFAIDPSGKWLLAENQQSDNITIFAIDPETGSLERKGPAVACPSPVCIKFLPKP